MKKVAIIGSVGVPANYGGFETLVENIIGENCSSDIEYTVFCSSRNYYNRIKVYKGAKLKYITFSANGAISILYDSIALARSIKGYDIVLALGVSGGVFMPFFKLFSKAKLITNIDGLEWKRGKWGSFAKYYLRLSEELALRFSDSVIADNIGIVNYISGRYKKKTELICYGGDHVVRGLLPSKLEEIIRHYGVERGEYSINICRIEPENNCDIILNTFSKNGMPFVMIGNWGCSKYAIQLREIYLKFSNIILVDAIYDLDTIYALRSNAKYYIHGHSAGGTNPSLVEAMFCGCSILSFDVVYNRETTNNRASYFRDSNELKELLTMGIDNSLAMMHIAKKEYCWRDIAKQYESLY